MKWISKVDYEWHDSDKELPSISSNVEFMDKDGNIHEGHVQVDMAGGYAAERTKKEVIEKACDWIQMNAKKYINAVGGCMYFDIVNATNNFRKAMES